MPGIALRFGGSSLDTFGGPPDAGDSLPDRYLVVGRRWPGYPTYFPFEQFARLEGEELRDRLRDFLEEGERMMRGRRDAVLQAGGTPPTRLELWKWLMGCKPFDTSAFPDWNRWRPRGGLPDLPESFPVFETVDRSQAQELAETLNDNFRQAGELVRFDVSLLPALSGDDQGGEDDWRWHPIAVRWREVQAVPELLAPEDSQALADAQRVAMDWLIASTTEAGLPQLDAVGRAARLVLSRPAFFDGTLRRLTELYGDADAIDVGAGPGDPLAAAMREAVMWGAGDTFEDDIEQAKLVVLLGVMCLFAGDLAGLDFVKAHGRLAARPWSVGPRSDGFGRRLGRECVLFPHLLPNGDPDDPIEIADPLWPADPMGDEPVGMIIPVLRRAVAAIETELGRAVGPPGAAATTTPAALPLRIDPPIDKTELEILRALRPAGRSVIFADLAAATGFDEKTCRVRVRPLEERGLVDRKGPRSGVYLTGQGERVLSLVDPPPPPANAAG